MMRFCACAKGRKWEVYSEACYLTQCLSPHCTAMPDLQTYCAVGHTLQAKAILYRWTCNRKASIALRAVCFPLSHRGWSLGSSHDTIITKRFCASSWLQYSWHQTARDQAQVILIFTCVLWSVFSQFMMTLSRPTGEGVHTRGISITTWSFLSLLFLQNFASVLTPSHWTTHCNMNHPRLLLSSLFCIIVRPLFTIVRSFATLGLPTSRWTDLTHLLSLTNLWLGASYFMIGHSFSALERVTAMWAAL